MDPDSELLLRLRSGDERAFVSLVERYHEPMLRLAASFVPSRAVAEEVEYLEGSLSARARRRFEAHLAGCPHCTEYLAQMRETISLTGRLEPEDLTPQMRDEFTDIYRRWRSEQQ